ASPDDGPASATAPVLVCRLLRSDKCLTALRCGAMLEWLRGIASSTAFQIALPLGVVALIGIGTLVGLIVSWLAFVGALAVVVVFPPHQAWLLRWGFRTTRLSSDPHNALVVSLQHEEWSVYQHAVWILMIKVKIRN